MNQPHPSNEDDSGAAAHLHILRATSLVGGATLAALIIGLARNKSIALLEGPEAIGLVGLFTAIVAMASSVSLFGLNTSVVRKLSPLAGHPDEAGRIRRSMWTLAWPLALVGGAGVWIAREPLSIFSTASASYAAAIGLLSLGVVGAVVGELQLAVLQSYGRLSDVARVKLWGALIATLLAIAAIWHFGTGGIVLAVLAVPATTAIAAFWFGRQLPSSRWSRLRKERVTDQWPTLLGFGTMIMLTGAIASAHQLTVRGLISQQMGLQDAGLYQAAWAIMWVNLSLVLNAMASDYYPRLAKAKDPGDTARLLHIQLHSTLMIAAPVLAATCVAAPLALTLLYSSQFTEASTLLRLLCVAAVLRIPIWALGFVLLTRGAAVPYLFGEVVFASIVPLTWILLPSVGLEGAGWAAVGGSVVSLGYYAWQVQRVQAVRMEVSIVRRIIAIFLFLLLTTMAFSVGPWVGLGIGLAGTLAIGWSSYAYLRRVIAA